MAGSVYDFEEVGGEEGGELRSVVVLSCSGGGGAVVLTGLGGGGQSCDPGLGMDPIEPYPMIIASLCISMSPQPFILFSIITITVFFPPSPPLEWFHTVSTPILL